MTWWNLQQAGFATVTTLVSHPQMRGECVDDFIAQAQERTRNAQSKSVQAAWNCWRELLVADQVTFTSAKIAIHDSKLVQTILKHWLNNDFFIFLSDIDWTHNKRDVCWMLTWMFHMSMGALLRTESPWWSIHKCRWLYHGSSNQFQYDNDLKLFC